MNEENIFTTEPEVAPPEMESAPHETLIQRIEEDFHEVVAAVEAIPAKVEGKISAAEAAVDVFWSDFVSNVSALVPTSVHNYVMEAKEALKARLKSLL